MHLAAFLDQVETIVGMSLKKQLKVLTWTYEKVDCLDFVNNGSHGHASALYRSLFYYALKDFCKNNTTQNRYIVLEQLNTK